MEAEQEYFNVETSSAFRESTSVYGIRNNDCTINEFDEYESNIHGWAINIPSVSNTRSSSSLSKICDIQNYVDEKIIDDLIERGKHEKNQQFLDLNLVLNKVFSNPKNLSKSFCFNQNDKLPTNLSETQVNFKSLRSSMKKVFGLNNYEIDVTINDAIMNLCVTADIHERYTTEKELEAYMHCFVICFDLTKHLETFVGFESGFERQYSALSELCHATCKLSISYHERLAHIWADHCKDSLHILVQSLKKRITEIVTYQGAKNIHHNDDIKNIIRVLKIVSYANNLAGDITSEKPLIPYEEFYNDALSEVMQQSYPIHVEIVNYMHQIKSPSSDENKYFSFLKYPFILSPVAKITVLHYWIESMGFDSQLKLKIRRDIIVDDVFSEFERVLTERPNDLTQPLVVEFVNEEAIDQGGVSKEFFQIIFEKVFDNDFGLFSYQEDSKTMWFQPYSPENNIKYKLVGIILGLAVMNGINLAVNFPMVIFRKLLGGTGSFLDLKDWSPILYQNLKHLLDYENDDMEECFDQTFTIVKKNASGQVIEHELKPGGADIKVGQHNKEEFVNLYSDYLLNESIDKQFQALKGGFEMVADVTFIRQIFRPEEFELLICGSKTFNFFELQHSTVYEGGYTKNSRVIQDFWSIVHGMTNEMKRKLLEFTTGSDRIPVGGLNRLVFIIQRNGSDCDRLPSSHTCFNVLLLPEYRNKEKTEERLLKALNYTRGFGLL